MTTERNGRRMIRFIAPNGKRPKIRLGKIDPRAAEEIREHVEHLAECWEGKKLPLPASAQWVSQLLSDPAKLWLYDRLAAAGLVGARQQPDGQPPKARKAKPADKVMANQLGPFIDAYIASRGHLKEGSLNNLKFAKRYLVERFGADRPLVDISPGDADEYRGWLRGQLAEGTTRRYCGRAREFFRAAVRKRLIPENPFGDMKDLNAKSNKEREFFITRHVAQQVLSAMVDAEGGPLVEWQLIFALSRYGALRCPSEHLKLTWEDVDWDRHKFTVHSPKTERHEGKETRVVPLFPELRPYLEAQFNAACDRLGRPPSGSEAVIVTFRYQGAKTNLRTGLLRFLSKAGVKPWPKLFQNLRASRATELAAAFPAYMAAAWCGHNEKVAEEHYWQITEADWQRAATQPTGERVENPGHKAGQKGPRNTPETRNEPDPCLASQTWKPPRNPRESTVSARLIPLIKLPGQDSNLE
jgi:integrase